jgi:para-nitrobenzyl esterase
VWLFIPGGGWAFDPSYAYSGYFNIAGGAADVVIVVISYRLNVFGFLAGDALKAESADGSVGNYGLQDQRAALQFVKQVAASFGGNGSQVTLAGESAGAASIASHLVSTRSAGLFSGAIMESGGFSDWTVQPYAISATRLPQLAANVNCSTAPDVLACLRALSVDAITAGMYAGLTAGFQQWSPVIDGVEIVADPRDLLAAGKVADVPILIGANHDEGTLFNNASEAMPAAEMAPKLTSVFGANITSIITPAYPLAQYPTPWWALVQVMTDSLLLCPAQRTASLLGRVPGRTSPVFVYQYQRVLALFADVIDPIRDLACTHGTELLPVFGYWPLLWGAGEVDLSNQMVRYWARFVAGGDPNDPHGADPVWAPYTAATRQVAALNVTAAGAANVTMLSGGVRAAVCNLWAGITIPPAYIWG